MAVMCIVDHSIPHQTGEAKRYKLLVISTVDVMGSIMTIAETAVYCVGKFLRE